MFPSILKQRKVYDPDILLKRGPGIKIGQFENHLLISFTAHGEMNSGEGSRAMMALLFTKLVLKISIVVSLTQGFDK